MPPCNVSGMSSRQRRVLRGRVIEPDDPPPAAPPESAGDTADQPSLPVPAGPSSVTLDSAAANSTRPEVSSKKRGPSSVTSSTSRASSEGSRRSKRLRIARGELPPPAAEPSPPTVASNGSPITPRATTSGPRKTPPASNKGSDRDTGENTPSKPIQPRLRTPTGRFGKTPRAQSTPSKRSSNAAALAREQTPSPQPRSVAALPRATTSAHQQTPIPSTSQSHRDTTHSEDSEQSPSPYNFRSSRRSTTRTPSPSPSRNSDRHSSPRRKSAKKEARVRDGRGKFVRRPSVESLSQTGFTTAINASRSASTPPSQQANARSVPLPTAPPVRRARDTRARDTPPLPTASAPAMQPYVQLARLTDTQIADFMAGRGDPTPPGDDDSPPSSPGNSDSDRSTTSSGELYNPVPPPRYVPGRLPGRQPLPLPPVLAGMPYRALDPPAHFGPARKRRWMQSRRSGLLYAARGPPDHAVARYLSAGAFDQFCNHCEAIHFVEEAKIEKRNPMGACCQRGKVNMPLIQPVPPFLKELMTGASSDAKHFQKYIIKYQAVLALATWGANTEFVSQHPFAFR